MDSIWLEHDIFVSSDSLCLLFGLNYLLLLLLLLLSRFSRVRLCATPEMAAHQAPPSLGFSRQEHWSGLPFPSPISKHRVSYIRLPGGSDGKESTCIAGDPGSTTGSGRSLGEGNGYPLQDSCLEKFMNREACRATVHRVAKSQICLKQLSTHAHTRISTQICSF